MLDIFSRYVVGWSVAATESADLAKAFLDAARARNPERFSTPPVPPKLPVTAWINPPTPAPQIQTV